MAVSNFINLYFGRYIAFANFPDSYWSIVSKHSNVSSVSFVNFFVSTVRKLKQEPKKFDFLSLSASLSFIQFLNSFKDFITFAFVQSDIFSKEDDFTSIAIKGFGLVFDSDFSVNFSKSLLSIPLLINITLTSKDSISLYIFSAQDEPDFFQLLFSFSLFFLFFFFSFIKEKSLNSCSFRSKSSNNILALVLLSPIFLEHAPFVIAKPQTTSDLNDVSLSFLTLIKSLMFIEGVKH